MSGTQDQLQQQTVTEDRKRAPVPTCSGHQTQNECIYKTEFEHDICCLSAAFN